MRMTPYSPDDLSPARVTSKAELLRRSLAATEGTRLIADYEDLFLAHKLAEIPGQDSARVQLLKGDKQSLVCVMNETAKPAEFKFSLPAA